MIIDLHTHLPAPRSEAIISCDPAELPGADEFPGQFYSVGIHPWSLSNGGDVDEALKLLAEVAGRDDVVAIGECGIDVAHRGAVPLFMQLPVFRSHIEISEHVGKPMLLHCVKAWDSIVALRREYAPCQPWIVHGFRGKPSVLQMLLWAGIGVSYGANFNPESVALTPADQLYAETDESSLSICEIIKNLQEANPAADAGRIAANIRVLLAR